MEDSSDYAIEYQILAASMVKVFDTDNLSHEVSQLSLTDNLQYQSCNQVNEEEIHDPDIKMCLFKHSPAKYQDNLKVWLRSHRMHKYWPVISEFSYLQLLTVNQEKLQATRKFTNGAINKLINMVTSLRKCPMLLETAAENINSTRKIKPRKSLPSQFCSTRTNSKIITNDLEKSWHQTSVPSSLSDTTEEQYSDDNYFQPTVEDAASSSQQSYKNITVVSISTQINQNDSRNNNDQCQPASTDHTDQQTNPPPRPITHPNRHSLPAETNGAYFLPPPNPNGFCQYYAVSANNYHQVHNYPAHMSGGTFGHYIGASSQPLTPIQPPPFAPSKAQFSTFSVACCAGCVHQSIPQPIMYSTNQFQNYVYTPVMPSNTGHKNTVLVSIPQVMYYPAQHYSRELFSYG